MYLILDTETTNLPQDNLPLDHPAQARICQLAFLVLDKDFKERTTFCSLIKPHGWLIQPGAQAKHRISQQDCELFGVNIHTALELLDDCARNVATAIIYNAKFDMRLIDTEVTLNEVAMPLVPNLNEIVSCLMETMTPICKLTGKIPGKYKWPKLEEAFRYCFSQEFIGAHDALCDCRATAQVYKWLLDKRAKETAGMIPA